MISVRFMYYQEGGSSLVLTASDRYSAPIPRIGEHVELHSLARPGQWVYEVINVTTVFHGENPNISQVQPCVVVEMR